MAADSYTKWLGVPSGLRPPDYYTLLGVQLFCRDVDAIETATRRQLSRLDELALHPNRHTRDAVQQMMNEVARARVDLVDPERRAAYDRQLAGRLGATAPTEARPQSLLTPRTRIEPAGPLGDGPKAPDYSPPAPKGAVSVAVKFEARVWKHLRKWKLNDQERRLLLAEAFCLGLTASDALKIIARNDTDAETLAKMKYNRKMRLAHILAATALATAIVWSMAYIVVGPRRDRLLRDENGRAATEAAPKGAATQQTDTRKATARTAPKPLEPPPTNSRQSRKTPSSHSRYHAP